MHSTVALLTQIPFRFSNFISTIFCFVFYILPLQKCLGNLNTWYYMESTVKQPGLEKLKKQKKTLRLLPVSYN